MPGPGLRGRRPAGAALALVGALAGAACDSEEVLRAFGADPTPRLELTPAALTLPVGGTGFATPRLGGNAISSATPDWSSDDPSVAIVDGSGNITCVGEGTTTVRAGLYFPERQEGTGDAVQVTCVVPTLVRLDADSFRHRHVVGESPCPDPIGEIAVTNASGVQVTLDLASGPGLSTDPDRLRLAPGESATVRLFFDCSVRQSFTAEVAVTATDAEGRTQVETVSVDVTVE